MAAKFFYRVFFTDATISQVPSAEEIEALQQAFPGTVITLQVEAGMRLSSLPEQDSYSYAMAYVWMGAEDDLSLEENYARLAEQLHFGFEDIVG
ncbi:hypothetical protein HSBAA_50530 [Vreelandella sulfidaeris]|uniref:Uncharacterized protein n=1 Tax=Vreelandella sulfidaeris TaxID=115553 RepID=A0A455UDP1_9GAMM|nr:hypothetical protein HSBAA_50530 [Halomonas sulfidaeris]